MKGKSKTIFCPLLVSWLLTVGSTHSPRLINESEPFKEVEKRIKIVDFGKFQTFASCTNCDCMNLEVWTIHSRKFSERW